jgi:hypothetical protein
MARAPRVIAIAGRDTRQHADVLDGRSAKAGGTAQELTKGHPMHPDVQTMTAQAWIDQRLREAARARLAVQARVARRRRQHSEVTA